MTSPPPPRALLLSGSLGMGHDVMANAFATSLESRGWSTRTLDAMALLGGFEHRAGEKVFRSLLKVPGGFDALHFAALRDGTALARWLDEQAARRITPRVLELLTHQPAELVVSVFATAASAMSRVRSADVKARTVTFCTDVNPHRMWVHPHTDWYLLTSPTAERFLRRFEPEASVLVVPAPVRPAFYDAPSRSDARAILGIPDSADVVLLMAGAWGIGPLVQVACALSAAGAHTIAVAGRNADVERRLRAAADTERRIRPYGFTDDIPTLMAAADVVVTSGGDTCSEARVIGRRLVLLDVVAGHGRENVQQELAQGAAVLAALEPDLLTRAVLHTLAVDDEPPRQDRRQQWEQALDIVLRG